jgi:hypothetical protein
VSFSNMSTGLPNTFVSDLVLNTAETLLFAATDAGPYVCLLSTGQWYSLATAITPVKEFRAVEWVAGSNIARFATFGRGVWDFQVTAQPLPVELADFKAKVANDQSVLLSWTTQSEQNVAQFEIERSLDGVRFEKILTTQPKSKNGTSTSRLDYETRDMFPPKGTVYYRLKTRDRDGKTADSKVISVFLGDNLVKKWTIVPSILSQNTPLSIQASESAGWLDLSVFDATGRLVLQKRVLNGQQIDLSNTGVKGVLVYRLSNNQRSETGKIMVF